MTREQFEQIFLSRVEKTKDLLITKAREYASDKERMHNFNRAASMNREHPLKSLHGMMTKHLVSYLDIVDSVNKGEKISEKLVDDKFGDIITYFFLAEALLYDSDSVLLTIDNNESHTSKTQRTSESN